MRRHPLSWTDLLRGLGLGLTIVLAGCEADPPAARQRDASPVAETAAPQPADDPTVAAVQAHADRLAVARQAAPVAADRAAPPVANEVMWLTPGSSDEDAPPTAAKAAAADLAVPAPVGTDFTSAANTVTIIDAEPSAPGVEVDATAATTDPTSDSAQALLNRLEADSASDFDKALRAVAVTLADPGATLAPAYLAPLTPEQEHAVRLYHDLMLTMRTQLVADDGRLDRDAFTSRLNELFGQQPITIRELKLCRRVNGYGVYEPFDSTTFLAGREQPVIVYVELDDFAALDRGDGRYIVGLQQDVTLYAADGLAVWRNEPVQIEDVSANRRRDFFVVQLIKLPARLSVGKYRLKVRVTDLNGGSIDERGINLDLVADRALVEKPAHESAPLR